jgi:hypothetical protein
MSNLGPKAEELKKFVYITAILLALWFLLLVGLLDRFNVGWHAFGRLPPAVTAESDWVRGATDPRRQIPIVFVIQQDLLSLTLVSFTEDREGRSYVAQLAIDDAAKTFKLIYIYSLRDEFRAGEGVQQGAAEVQVTGPKGFELRGEYWTNTKTRGRLILSHRSSYAVSSFREAKAKFHDQLWRRFDC